jgi:hypothetical protein
VQKISAQVVCAVLTDVTAILVCAVLTDVTVILVCAVLTDVTAILVCAVLTDVTAILVCAVSDPTVSPPLVPKLVTCIVNYTGSCCGNIGVGLCLGGRVE